MDFLYEQYLKDTKKYKYIAGVDEAGRGPLAGPLFVSSFIFLQNIPLDDKSLINDSKLLSKNQRKNIFKKFVLWKEKRIVDFSICFVMPSTIDKHGIQYATVLAIKRSVAALSIKPEYVVIDMISYKKKILDIPYEAIKQADKSIISVAASSIVAKVARDNMMVRYGKKYPEFEFSSHNGYGTKKHYMELKLHGTTPIHRKSFRLS